MTRGTTAILAALVAELDLFGGLPPTVRRLITEAKANLARRYATDRENGAKNPGKASKYRVARKGTRIEVLRDGVLVGAWSLLATGRVWQIEGVKSPYLGKLVREFLRKENR
jgi:hypothetical protein